MKKFIDNSFKEIIDVEHSNIDKVPSATIMAAILRVFSRDEVREPFIQSVKEVIKDGAIR